jgi:hypothetical protein
MSPLAGLQFVVTICVASPGNAGMLHLTARHTFSGDGRFASEILAGPGGAQPDLRPSGRAELIAEQGESLIFLSTIDGDETSSTVVLTLHSASAGEMFSTYRGEWVRGVAAIESLPAVAHEH